MPRACAIHTAILPERGTCVTLQRFLRSSWTAELPKGARPAASRQGARGRGRRRTIAVMARLVRMDHTGHTTLAEWTADDAEAVEAAAAAFRAELDRGYFGMVSTGEGHAEQVTELPRGADLVILRLPISGG
jgi:hypothetical protein